MENESLISKYSYAVARVYEGKDDNGFPTITIKPLFICEDEEIAVIGAQEQREYEKAVARTNPLSNLIDYFAADNIMAIKIYGVG